MIFVFDSLFSSSTLLGQVIPWEYLLLSRFKAQASIIKEKRYNFLNQRPRVENDLILVPQGTTEYDYPEYPIYERSDQVDYSNGGLLDDYPTGSFSQSGRQQGSQRSGQEDFLGYQKLGYGYQDQTTKRFLRRFGNSLQEHVEEEDATV